MRPTTVQRSTPWASSQGSRLSRRPCSAASATWRVRWSVAFCWASSKPSARGISARSRAVCWAAITPISLRSSCSSSSSRCAPRACWVSVWRIAPEEQHTMKNTKINWILGGLALLILPLVLQYFGNAWVRIADLALLYVVLALGLNIVVGYAGLLDLGYVAFYAVGAYLFALMASPHLADNFAAFAAMFPDGLHTSLWLVIPAAALLAAFFGALLGAPTLKLRGDYPAILTNGPKGIGQIDSVKIFGLDLGKRLEVFGFDINSVTLYYYLFLVLVLVSIVICYRLQDSRLGRAWMAIRADENAAKAMGINTRNMKLLAFGMGASFGGVSGAMFGAFQGFV